MRLRNGSASTKRRHPEGARTEAASRRELLRPKDRWPGTARIPGSPADATHRSFGRREASVTSMLRRGGSLKRMTAWGVPLLARGGTAARANAQWVQESEHFSLPASHN